MCMEWGCVCMQAHGDGSDMKRKHKHVAYSKHVQHTEMDESECVCMGGPRKVLFSKQEIATAESTPISINALVFQ